MATRQREAATDGTGLCGQSFFDHQGRLEGVCLDRAVPGTPFCAQHLVEYHARKDEQR